MVDKSLRTQPRGREAALSNPCRIRRWRRARGIRTIEADGYVQSAVRSGIHMTVEGHRKVARQLAASIR
jgi:acyl-CoA thioesterase I